MSTRKLSDDDVSCAILNDQKEVVACDLKTYLEWAPRNQHKCLIQRDELKGWTVETCFSGMSFLLDGPLWFKTVAYHDHPYPEGARPRHREFATLEHALNVHASFVELIRDRNSLEI